MIANMNLKTLLLSAAALLFAACSSSDDVDAPAALTQLKTPQPVVRLSSDKAVFSWVRVEDAASYNYELTANDGVSEEGSVVTSSYTVTLDAGVVYRFRVKAMPQNGSSQAASEWSEYVTASSNMLPAPQPELDEDSVTDTAATVMWSAVDEAAGYKYELYESGASAAVESGTESGLSISFSELKEGTAYRFRVMALASESQEEKVNSPWSDYLSFSTRGHELLPAPSVIASQLTDTEATLSWEAVAGAVNYTYELTEEGSEEALKSGETVELSVSFSDLKEFTSYTFRVKALADAEDPYTLDSEYATLGFRTRSEAVMNLGLPEHEQDGVLRAFPGAEGAGMFTSGGRGGKVYHVTTLEDVATAGSLRYAINQSGARIVVFDVAGTITLKSSLKISRPDITIAGQTAPGDGICLKGYGLEIAADNIIIRYLRIRPGDEYMNDGLDALGGRYMQNIIIDHCSLSWSTDECVSFYVNRNMTLQYCLAYESLRNGGHSKGSHGYAGIWGGAPASFHHNIVAHNDSRNPRLDSPEQYGDGPTPGATATAKGIFMKDRMLDFRNNVIYNYCNYPAYGGVGITMNFVGNYYKWGPASVNGCGPSYKNGVMSGNKACHRDYFCSCDTYYDGNGVSNTAEKYVSGNPSIYTEGNSNVLDSSLAPNFDTRHVTSNNQNGFIAGTTSGSSGSCPFSPVWGSSNYPVVTSDGKACSVTTHEAADAFEVLIRYCGASLRQDSADARVLADVKNGTGTSSESNPDKTHGAENHLASWYGIIDSPEDKGGYPVLTATEEEIARAATDTDQDGIPDYYEDLFGLDRNNADDANQISLDPQGIYTNMDIYLHYLVKDITAAQTANGTYAPIK